MSTTSKTRRRIATILLFAVVTVLLSMASSGTAFADAGTHASCLGHEASGISPKGTSDEFPGGVPQLRIVILELFPDAPYGSIVSTVAHIHAGSHEACDEATE